MSNYTTYFSDRGIPLVFNRVLDSTGTPVLTVENYLKWYTLYLINPDASVVSICFPDNGYCDHVPYPSAVEILAEENGWYLCEESMAMIVGRYYMEFKNHSIEDMNGL